MNRQLNRNPLRQRILSFFVAIHSIFWIWISYSNADQSSPTPSSPTSSFIGDPAYKIELIKKANELHLEKDLYWTILLHYRPRWIAGVKSEINVSEFFNAP